MIDVLFFGRMADIAQRRRTSVAAPAEGLGLFTLRDAVFAEALAVGQVAREAIRMSVNQAVVIADQPLLSGDEVAFFSVFSGG